MRVAIKSTEGAGASFSVKGVWRVRVCVPLMFAAVLAAGSVKAATYYWKPGSTQGLWTELSNWSTEGVEGAAAGALPGSSDVLYGPASYNFDLENQERTVSKCKQESDFDTAYCFFLEKGTFKVTGELRRCRGSIDVNDAATLLIPSGATIYTGVYQGITEARRFPVNINSGGSMDVRGTVRFYNTKYNVVSGGTLTFAPSSLQITAEQNACNAGIENNGTLNLPNGLTMGAFNYPASGASFTVWQTSGTMNLGGVITTNSIEGTFNVVFSGGTVNVTGNASFDVSSAQVSGPVTFNVAAGKTLNTTSLEIVGDGVLTKTGPGYIAFPAMAQAVTVSEGGVALDSGTYDLSAVTFAANTTVRIATFGGTINQGGYPASLTENATFTADLSSASAGTTIFNSDDATLLGKIKTDLATFVPQGLELTVSGTQLMLETATSDADTFTITGNITEGAGWGGDVPGAGANVAISGEGVVGTLPSGASFPAWSSIEVKNGATLRIEATATLPTITLNKHATLEIGNNATVTLSNASDLSGVVNVLGEAITIPALTVETGSTLNVPGGMKFSNVNIDLKGTIATSGDGGVTFGYAGTGDTTYIGLLVDGGTVSLTSTTTFSRYDVSPLEFCCPASGGTVVAVDDMVLSAASITPVSSGHRYTGYPEYGLHMGINNPQLQRFTVVFDGTGWGVGGKTIIKGGATFLLRNGGSYENEENREAWGRTAEVSEAGTIVIDSGTEFCLNAMGNYGGEPLYINPTVQNHQSVIVRTGGRFESYGTSSSSTPKGVFAANGNCTYSIYEPWTTNKANTIVKHNVPFTGFAAVEVASDSTLTIATRNTRKSSGGCFTDASGDRVVSLANVPITGAGSIALDNANVNKFGVIVTCGSNTATGSASVVAPGEGEGDTTLYFANGANWAGTVTAGNVALTNLVDGAAASTNAFGTLDLAAERTFPVRVWKSGGAVVAHDGLNVDNYATNGGKIAFDVRGEAMELGEGFILGTIGAESPLPALARPWVAKRRDGGLLQVSISSGFSIIVR